MLKVRLAHDNAKMVTALDSPNPEKQKLSKRIAEDTARFLEGGGQIQVLSIQARHHPDFDMGMGISEEVR